MLPASDCAPLKLVSSTHTILSVIHTNEDVHPESLSDSRRSAATNMAVNSNRSLHPDNVNRMFPGLVLSSSHMLRPNSVLDLTSTEKVLPQDMDRNPTNIPQSKLDINTRQPYKPGPVLESSHVVGRHLPDTDWTVGQTPIMHDHKYTQDQIISSR